ncbi:MAG: glycosyltransferase [Fusobacteriaceae bacterium]
MELSIIVPIYNVEIYLRECLESLYKIKGIKKEIILVNDGSKDNSYKIIEEYKEKYPDITKVINKTNGGLSSARNSGLKEALGEYISFIDSDDFVDHLMFEEFFKLAIKDKVEVAVGNLKYYINNTASKQLFRSEKLKKLGIVNGNVFLETMLEKPKCYREEVVDDLYKREFLIENDLFFKEGLIHEDTLFSTLLYLRCEKIKYYDYPFYFYRQRDGGIMSQTNDKSLKSLEEICNILKVEYFKLESERLRKPLSKLIISFYKAILYKEYDKGGDYKTKFKNYRKLYLELKGYKNKVYNEDLLFVSFFISRTIRKILNKEISNKQKIPKIK